MSLPHCWQESVLGRALSPLCPPSTTAQIEDSHPAEKPQHLRTCVPWVTSHPQRPPPIPPPHILALTRDFSTSPEGSNASQVSCAELVPSSSMKPRAQKAFLPQQPILRLVAGFPSAQVTSAGPGEEVKGVKEEEGRWPGWGLRAAGPKDFACFRLGPPHRVPGICVPTQHLRPGQWLVLRLFLAHPVTPVMRVAASWTAQHEWLGRGRRGHRQRRGREGPATPF